MVEDGGGMSSNGRWLDFNNIYEMPDGMRIPVRLIKAELTPKGKVDFAQYGNGSPKAGLRAKKMARTMELFNILIHRELMKEYLDCLLHGNPQNLKSPDTSED